MVQRVTGVVFAVIAVLAGGGCDTTIDTRNCDLVSKGGSDVYNLKYVLLLPADCPVPIGSPGERKAAAASIRDSGQADFYYATVSVRNSDLVPVGDNWAFFGYVNGGTETRAEPSTAYSAATAGPLDLDKRYDYGHFEVTNDLSQIHTGVYGEVKITYSRSAMANLIDGTSIPPRNSTATWRAQVTGGVPPYRYYWYRDGTLVGTSEFYTGETGTESFGLRAAVVDQTMTERVAVMPVDVGGALAHIDGPEMAYLYTNNPLISNATWTAVVQGGTAPFTYQWYRDGYATGANGPSHTEHIDERVDFTLWVVVQDVTGKTAVDQKHVRVAQRDCPSCPAY